MLHRLVVALVVLLLTVSAWAQYAPVRVDKTIAGTSRFPIPPAVDRVGSHPGAVKSGAGYFYDDVLEYRVWLHPKQGARPVNGGSVYFAAFAQFERALAFSSQEPGAEPPLVLVRQLEYVNEPSPGVFEVVRENRLTEWRVEWLEGHKRSPGAIEKFIKEHRR